MARFARTHSTAFAPNDLRGFDMLEEAFGGSVLQKLDGTELGKSWRVDRARFDRNKRQSAPATVFADVPSSEDEGSVTGGEVKVAESFGPREAMPASEVVVPVGERAQQKLRPSSPRMVTPPHLIGDHAHMPPTPPTMANSDENEPRGVSVATSGPFADDVRAALHKKSTLSSGGLHLPTPEPSPPAGTDRPASPTRRPFAALLQRHTSSRAESFITARENPNQSQSNLLRVVTPEQSDGNNNSHWMRSSHGVRSVRSIQHNDDDSMASSPSSGVRGGVGRRDGNPNRSPEHPPTHHTQRAFSPHRTPDANTDWEKHISYINDDDAVPYFMQTPSTAVTQHDLSPPRTDHSSAETMNNKVYKRIQDVNVKRHSLASSPGAVAAEIYQASPPQRSRTIKRIARHEALRDVSAAGRSQHGSVGDETMRTVRRSSVLLKPRSLDASPVFDHDRPSQRLPRVSDRRVVTDPMVRMTKTAMAAAVIPSPLFHREPKLRHVSRSSRLESRSPSLIRTSNEIPGGVAPIAPVPAPASTSTTSRPLRHAAKDKNLDKDRLWERASADLPRYPSPEMHPGFESRPGLPNFPLPGQVRHTDINSRPLKKNFRPVATATVEASDKPHVLRHFPKAAKLENSPTIRRSSQDVPSSPRTLHSQHNSLDLRLLHPITTPGSVSAQSDQSAVEFCEAKGVNLYPHHNESLLVVQHAFKPVSEPHSALLGGAKPPTSLATLPHFAAIVEKPSAKLSQADNENCIADNPLTYPRPAPAPPAFRVIPPTPTPSRGLHDSLELARRSVLETAELPSRRPSLKQRVRRFSESVIDNPLFSRSSSLRSRTGRREPHDTGVITRPRHLGPQWQPQRFWDGYDSADDEEEEEEEVYDPEDLDGLPMAYETRLPAGGDTSSIESRKQRKGVVLAFPRSMSVRIPGFRGEGGFLLGNSLGLERHGSNTRRHYVSVGRRRSEEDARGWRRGKGKGNVGGIRGMLGKVRAKA
ncbi:hypothetical protein LTR62_008822 [Meristemomyces frigidus]|uniref:Uncharacterized protein n=1 Tax=Meristemomyces frigidus TaxID=1508187 RepID=A0AAN7YGX2_9PEZI|nr:hypothetical protein LTR62_008822 [Meristemomyces frigidus]